MTNQEFKEMSLIDHLTELCKIILQSFIYIIIIFVICFYFASDLFYFLAKPLVSLLQTDKGQGFIYTALQEAFFTELKIAFFFALFFAIKFIVDFALLFPILKFFKREDLIKWILPFELFYSFYIILIIILSLTRKFEWKGRIHSKQMKSASLNRLAWQKLKKNRLSFFALCYILLVVLIALFAVVISPDSSPNANEMHIELAAQKPLTKILFLEIPKNKDIKLSFMESFFLGNPLLRGWMN